MWLIWFLLAVGLVVIFVIAVTTTRRYGRRDTSATKGSTNTSHRAKQGRNHRGRGRR